MKFWERLKQLKRYEEVVQEQTELIASLECAIGNKNTEIAKLNAEIESITIEKEKVISDRDAEVEKTRQEQQKAIEFYKESREKAVSSCAEAESELGSIRKEIAELQSKLSCQELRLKQYKALVSRIRKSLNEDGDVSNEINAELEALTPTVEIHLHSHDIKDLRKLLAENNKLMKETLTRYEKRYTTKSNKAIYQLMVIALQAELQNILVDLKFSTIEKCRANLKDIINKYLQIATDGNQTIAPTLNTFIAEIEILFGKSIDIEYEYFIQREKEREEQQALREQMRQEAEERRALEQAQKQIEKEESKYKTEIANVEEQISQTQDEEKLRQLMQRIEELKSQLEVVNQKKEEIISRQNGKAGHVYVISNLGSFGENTFKIGMTRRLEPMDRIKELGDASVPFSFDVHSFIFSDDAVGLEQELHKRLHEKRKNKVNMRKEFFDVSIEELETLVAEISPSAEFNKTMIATEYRRGLSIKEGDLL